MNFSWKIVKKESVNPTSSLPRNSQLHQYQEMTRAYLETSNDPRSIILYQSFAFSSREIDVFLPLSSLSSGNSLIPPDGSISYLNIDKDNSMKRISNHSIKIVKSIDFRWFFGEFLIKCIGNVMSWISTENQNCFSNFR